MGGSVPSTAEELQADAYEEAKAAADQMIQALDASMTDIQMTVYLDKDGVLTSVLGSTVINGGITGSDGDSQTVPTEVAFEAVFEGGAYPLQNLSLIHILSQIQLLVTEPLTADPMLATVLGGLLIGAGIGLVIRAGSSTGGNDVPVLLLKKKLGIPLSVSMYGFDIVILLFQIPYSQLEKALYSIILIILYSMIADKASTMGKSRCV